MEELGASRSHCPKSCRSLRIALERADTPAAIPVPTKLLQQNPPGFLHCTVSKLVSGVQLTKELLWTERDGTNDFFQRFLSKVKVFKCVTRQGYTQESESNMDLCSSFMFMHSTSLNSFCSFETTCTQLTGRLDQDCFKECAKVEMALLSRWSPPELDQLLKKLVKGRDVCYWPSIADVNVLKEKLPESINTTVFFVTINHQDVHNLFPNVVRLFQIRARCVQTSVSHVHRELWSSGCGGQSTTPTSSIKSCNCRGRS